MKLLDAVKKHEMHLKNELDKRQAERDAEKAKTLGVFEKTFANELDAFREADIYWESYGFAGLYGHSILLRRKGVGNKAFRLYVTDEEGYSWDNGESTDKDKTKLLYDIAKYFNVA